MYSLKASDTAPLYRQLYLQIREKILSGNYPAQLKLPSIRDLSDELAVSRNTVEGAFSYNFV